MIPFVILAIENDEDRIFMQNLYESYHRLMCAQAYEVLHDWHNVEDVLSEACVALIDKIQILTTLERPALKAYVVSTIRNTAVNYGKRLSRQRGHSVDDPAIAFETVANDDADVDSGLLLADEVADVRKAILKLPEYERVALQMRFYQDLSYEEIGKAMGIKPESARKFILRARRDILEIIKSGQ